MCIIEIFCKLSSNNTKVNNSFSEGDANSFKEFQFSSIKTALVRQ